MTKVRMHLKGGLGNQLFILAAGIRISKSKRSEHLILDTSFLDRDNLRNYELEPYELPNTTKVRSGVLHGWAHKKAASRFLKWLNQPYSENLEDRLDPLNLKTKCYEGYFQNYRKVDEVRTEMIRIIDKVTPANVIENLPDLYLAVHLRRGDYLQPLTLEKHGLVSASYVQNALNGFHEELDTLPVLVFSDSLEIAKIELAGIDRNLIFIGPESTEAQDVIQIMSKAQGLVISNSSLSWWGAWLATRRDLDSNIPVAAPSEWFADGSSAEDILPEDWKKYGN